MVGAGWFGGRGDLPRDCFYHWRCAELPALPRGSHEGAALSQTCGCFPPLALVPPGFGGAFTAHDFRIPLHVLWHGLPVGQAQAELTSLGLILHPCLPFRRCVELSAPVFPALPPPRGRCLSCSPPYLGGVPVPPLVGRFYGDWLPTYSEPYLPV